MKCLNCMCRGSWAGLGSPGFGIGGKGLGRQADRRFHLSGGLIYPWFVSFVIVFLVLWNFAFKIGRRKKSNVQIFMH